MKNAIWLLLAVCLSAFLLTLIVKEGANQNPFRETVFAGEPAVWRFSKDNSEVLVYRGFMKRPADGMFIVFGDEISFPAADAYIYLGR